MLYCNMATPAAGEVMNNDKVMSFKDVAVVCRRSYITIWRLARVRGRLTHFKRLGLFRVVDLEVIEELTRNLIVCPGNDVPRVVLGPGVWLTMMEASTELGVPYDHVRRHIKEFTRTRFFGKVLLLKGDLNSSVYRQRSQSGMLRNREKVRAGLNYK